MKFLTLLLTLVSCSSFNHKKYKDVETERFNQKHRTSNTFSDLPYFEKNPKQLSNSVQKSLEAAEKEISDLLATKPQNIIFKNTFPVLENIYDQVSLVNSRAHLIASTSNSKELREEAQKQENIIDRWYIEVSSRKDIYEFLKKVSSKGLKGEDLKLYKETLLSFKRIGLHLSSAKQKRVQKLRKEISELKNHIRTNINNSNSDRIELTPTEVKGLPEDVIQGLERNSNGNYLLGIGVTHQVISILLNSPIENVRKKVFIKRNQRAQKENKNLIEKVLQKRSELANILGYTNWADYQIETKMAKNSRTALKFVDDLIKGLTLKFEKEKKVLTNLKKEETKNPKAILKAWDVGYYSRLLDKKSFDLDTNDLKKYFPYKDTLQGMFNIFEKVFSINIDFITAPYTWDEKVQLVKISDAKSNELKGYLYLDMFPRPDNGKYGHFAMFTIRSGKRLPNSRYRSPVAALICNFPETTPSLLRIEHVETLFHEFGHALHGILTRAKYPSFAGTRVPGDFVEAPSQMLENWVYDKKVLDSFAVNYQNSNDKIPASILKKLKASKKATIAMFYRRQLSFAKMDLLLHRKSFSSKKLDAIQETNKTLKTVFLPYPNKTSFITSFGHLFGGYDAGYYGYAWADSLAADMASVFEKSSLKFLDQKIGEKLRKEIYEPGDGRDVSTSLKRFLGRPPSNKAFIKKLGI